MLFDSYEWQWRIGPPSGEDSLPQNQDSREGAGKGMNMLLLIPSRKPLNR